MFVLVVAVFAVGVTLIPLVPALGMRVEGVGLVALALWLARYDIARRTVRDGAMFIFSPARRPRT
ncbi:MAG: hypothetical protein ABI573_03300 [Chloroflexota bacterium]